MFEECLAEKRNPRTSLRGEVFEVRAQVCSVNWIRFDIVLKCVFLFLRRFPFEEWKNLFHCCVFLQSCLPSPELAQWWGTRRNHPPTTRTHSLSNFWSCHWARISRTSGSCSDVIQFKWTLSNRLLIFYSISFNFRNCHMIFVAFSELESIYQTRWVRFISVNDDERNAIFWFPWVPAHCCRDRAPSACSGPEWHPRIRLEDNKPVEEGRHRPYHWHRLPVQEQKDKK